MTRNLEITRKVLSAIAELTGLPESDIICNITDKSQNAVAMVTDQGMFTNQIPETYNPLNDYKKSLKKRELPEEQKFTIRTIQPNGLNLVGDMLKKYNLEDTLKLETALLALGKSDTASIAEFNSDRGYFKEALNLNSEIPTVQKFRNRLNQIGVSQNMQILEGNVMMLKQTIPSKLDCGYVTLDIDVIPLYQQKSRKKQADGCMLVTAYIGTEGYLCNAELYQSHEQWEENQSDFVTETIRSAEKITENPLLLRMKSDYDINQHEIKFIMQLPEYRVILDKMSKVIQEQTEVTEDENNQLLFTSETESKNYWTNLNLSEETVLNLYAGHNVCELYWKEILLDMDIQNLKCRKFDTNCLIIKLVILAYNILKITGKGERIRNVVNQLINSIS